MWYLVIATQADLTLRLLSRQEFDTLSIASLTTLLDRITARKVVHIVRIDTLRWLRRCPGLREDLLALGLYRRDNLVRRLGLL